MSIEKELQKMVDAYIQYKKAEKIFAERKEAVDSQLAYGKYETKDGSIVNKILTSTKTLDKKRLAEENPNIDLTKYESSKECTRISISNVKI